MSGTDGGESVDDIDWSCFSIAANHDGGLDFEHIEMGCFKTWYLTEAEASIASLMELAKEHLETCPVWVGEG